jgi:hypothetical protein
MDDGELRKEVFAWYGSAAYAAQCFEVELTILLLLAYRLRHPSASPQDLDKVDVRLSKLALGQLVNELKREFVVHPEFETLLTRYLQTRNYLTHRFFFENGLKLMSRGGCGSMLAELKEIEASMREANGIAETISGRVKRVLGIPEEVLQAHVQAALRKASEEESDEDVS